MTSTKKNKKQEEQEQPMNSAVLEKEESFADLYRSTQKDIQEDKIVKGKVVGLTDKEVLVDIGYKSEGIVPREEFAYPDEIEIGQEIDVYLESIENEEGMVVLSKAKADKMLGWEKTISSYKEGDEVEGRVVRKVKGGLMVDIGMEAFLPASQIDIKPLKDLNLDDYYGKHIRIKILKINPERKNIVVSRRELLESSRKVDRDKLLGEIEEGQTRQGIVKNITDFGVFIDLNGLDGLLHITDMTWGRINHPSEMVELGDEIEVIILKFDREKERVSLGLKQKTQNPWQGIVERYPVGKRAEGKVVNIMPYGAFVEVEAGVEGLIHISEMSWTKKISHPSEMLSVGDKVQVVVLEIDPEHKKLSLGMKQIESNPWDTVNEKYSIGSKIKGKVRSITNYGVFVELEAGIDGLVHISDISWTKKFNHPSDLFKEGQEIDAVILDVDSDNKKMSLGMKQLEQDPWDKISERYTTGDIVKGVVTKTKTFGVFVRIEDGIEGLIHVSQLSKKPVENAENYFPEGHEVEAMIVKIDREERKLSLTLNIQDSKK